MPEATSTSTAPKVTAFSSPKLANPTELIGMLAKLDEFYLYQPPAGGASFHPAKTNSDEFPSLRPEEFERVLDELVIGNFTGLSPTTTSGYSPASFAQLTPVSTPLLAGEGTCPSGQVQTVDDVLDDFTANSPRLLADLPSSVSRCADDLGEAVLRDANRPAAMDESCGTESCTTRLPSTFAGESSLSHRELGYALDNSNSTVSISDASGLGAPSPSVHDPLEDELACWHLQQGYESASLAVLNTLLPSDAVVAEEASGGLSPCAKGETSASDVGAVYATPKSMVGSPFTPGVEGRLSDPPSTVNTSALFDYLLGEGVKGASPCTPFSDEAPSTEDERFLVSPRDIEVPLIAPSPNVRRKKKVIRGFCGEDARRFVCDYPGCGRAFARRFNLGTHKETHLPGSNRKFRCDNCIKSFSRKHDLGRHIESVHKIKPHFVCDGCGKSFPRREALRRHVEKDCDT